MTSSRLARWFWLWIALLTPLASQAGIEHAPPDFPYGGGRAVFTDFLSAEYAITYDVAAAKATVVSEIVFELPRDGHPLFDLVPNPTSIVVDGSVAESETVRDPDQASTFRALKAPLRAGRHRMTVTHSLSRLLKFTGASVSSAFWMTDLSDRQYLEKYLPSSFEYDTVPMRFIVELKGSDLEPHTIYANGVVRSLGPNRFSVDFPASYTVSSIFYHLTPESAFPVSRFNYTSIDGRTLPVVIYTSGNLKSYEKETRDVLAELESDYGPFPHPQLVIYGAGSGGMEYSGATMTSLWALGHELFHSYNARSVRPANGNAGWIDEAISSWRDDGYALRSSPGFSSTRMAGRSTWRRMTDDAAYDEGAQFLAWIAQRMKDRGASLKSHLKVHFSRNQDKTITTELFRDELEAGSGLSLRADFDRYIYGKNSVELPRIRAENPYHPRLTEAELEALL